MHVRRRCGCRMCVRGRRVHVRAYVVIVCMYGGTVHMWGVTVAGFTGGTVRVTGFVDGTVRVCESRAVAVAISVRAWGVVG